MSPEIFLTAIKEKSPAFFSVVLISSAVLLFAPNSFISCLGLSGFVLKYKSEIGFSFLFAASFLIIAITIFLIRKALSWIKVKSTRKKNNLLREKYMENLTKDEVLYLLPYLFGVNTLKFQMEDGVRGGLKAKEIIYRASNVGSMIDGISYNINPWALEYLKNNSSVYEKYFGEIKNQQDFDAIYQSGKPWVRKRWL